ncbi:MAG TPA: hypothetical protein VM307_09165 [Egibacteraceae bacterium]|nr:hypothetical protein [Egibacteraceae bacterium]
MSRVPALNDATEWLKRMKFAYEIAAPRRYLFVMSHMRSYSTLLCHILNSNPDIDGYVEMHKPYTKDLDLLELTLRVRHTKDAPLTGRYVVDKVLHNYRMGGALERDDVYALFSIREPERAIRSIYAMGLRREKPDWKSKPPKVVRHYVQRLKQLQQDAKKIRGRSLYFDAQDLVDNTDAVLAGITRFLDLKQPLRPQYETAELTGRPRFGDASPFIKTGAIATERDDYSHLDIPDELMERAHRAYERCRYELATTCTVAIGERPPKPQTAVAPGA